MNESKADSTKSYVAYDLETSGFFDDGGEFVEIGAVRVEDGEVTGEFSELCALEGPMDPTASRINHITDEMLEGRRPRSEVFSDFCDFVGDLPVLGFNNHHFDDEFIDREAARAGKPSPTENGSLDVRVILGNHGSLAKWCDTYKIENDEAHRALSDAHATRQLFGAARQK